MRGLIFLGTVGTVLASLSNTSCTLVSGLNEYSACTDCKDATSPADASADVKAAIPASDGPVVEGGATSDATDGPLAEGGATCNATSCGIVCDAGYSACGNSCVDEHTDITNCGGCGAQFACSEGATCQSGLCVSPNPDGATHSCSIGGCNVAGGACSASGQGCYCASDAACLSGKCVKVTGQNDLSCGGNCTGSGAADGFDCELGSPGIPAPTSSGAFGYTPSNLTVAQMATYTAHVPSSGTALNCNMTYTSGTTGGATTWCGGTGPYVYTNQAQSGGGPNFDVLVFQSLTLNNATTLTLAGTNPVVFLVAGNATLAGAIHADGTTGASGGGVNTNTPGASGPGGNYSCPFGVNAGNALNGGPAASDNNCNARNAGGGGGGGSTQGGTGSPGTQGNAGAGGAARSNASASPLYGGCPGGTSGAYACTTYGGGGGGAIQISVARSLSGAGSITANGGTGGTSTCSTAHCIAGTYPGGGGGGGSGGAVLLEYSNSSFTGTTSVAGGNGGGARSSGADGHGPGATSAIAGGDGTVGSSSGYSGGGGGGGGGGYGYIAINGGKSAANICTTPLSPAPILNSTGTACLCVADSDCSSGKCVNANSQCTGTCTGSGAPDVADCQVLTSP